MSFRIFNSLADFTLIKNKGMILSVKHLIEEIEVESFKAQIQHKVTKLKSKARISNLAQIYFWMMKKKMKYLAR